VVYCIGGIFHNLLGRGFDGNVVGFGGVGGGCVFRLMEGGGVGRGCVGGVDGGLFVGV